MVFHASAKRLIIISDCPGNKQAVYVATCWSIPVTAWTTSHLTLGKRRSEEKVKFTKAQAAKQIFWTCVRHIIILRFMVWSHSNSFSWLWVSCISFKTVTSLLSFNLGIMYQMSGRDTQPYRRQKSALNARITADRLSVSQRSCVTEMTHACTLRWGCFYSAGWLNGWIRGVDWTHRNV